jgi:hypothetical protein
MVPKCLCAELSFSTSAKMSCTPNKHNDIWRIIIFLITKIGIVLLTVASTILIMY